MNKQNQMTMTNLNTGLLAKAMLIGGAFACVLISLLVFGTETNPAWSEYWRIRPLLIVTAAGAAGGAVFYFMNYWFPLTGWKKLLLNLLCLVVAIVGLWIGTVLGLDGTLWN